MVASFGEVFPLLHKYLGDGLKNDEYVEYVVTQLTIEPVASEERTRQHSKNAYKDLVAGTSVGMRRQWYKRGFPKRVANGILTRYNSDGLYSPLSTLSDETASLLVGDLKPLLPGITKLNYADVITDWMTDFLYMRAKRKKITSQQRKDEDHRSDELKARFGSHLLREAQMTCMGLGCHQPLTILDSNGISQDLYEAVLIDPGKEPEMRNVAALCPRCALNHLETANTKSRKALLETKTSLSTSLALVDLLGSEDIGRQLLPVIAALSNYKPNTERIAIRYDVATVSEKIDAVDEFMLFHQVQDSVTTYYSVVHEILQELDASGELDTELLRNSIKGDYLRLKNKSRSEAFTAITTKISRATKSDQTLSAIVAAYFVQSCDIFTPDPKLTGGKNAPS